MKKIIRTLPPRENETKHLVKSIQAHVKESSEVEIVDFDDRALVARELLERLFLLSLEFTSYEGLLSRVIGRQLVDETKSPGWQEAAHNHDNRLYGLSELPSEIPIIALKRDSEYRFVYDLMETAHLKINSDTNQGKATDKPTDVSTCYFKDIFLDRSHSIWLANHLLEKNANLIQEFEKLKESQRLKDVSLSELKEWQEQDVRRNALFKLLGFFWRRNNLAYYENRVRQAEEAVKNAQASIERIQIGLGRTLARVYRNNETSSVSGDNPDEQKRFFYRQFFGHEWPSTEDFREPDLPTAGLETFTDRRAYIGRIQKLKTFLLMYD